MFTFASRLVASRPSIIAIARHAAPRSQTIMNPTREPNIAANRVAAKASMTKARAIFPSSVSVPLSPSPPPTGPRDRYPVEQNAKQSERTSEPGKSALDRRH